MFRVQQVLPIFCIFCSGCAFTNFKIKFDNPQDEQFSKKIISVENTVKTTPVEFASAYNVYAPSVANVTPNSLLVQNKASQEQFDPSLVQQAKHESQSSTDTSVKTTHKSLVQAKSVETEEVESLIAQKSKIKSLKFKKKNTVQRAFSSTSEQYAADSLEHQEPKNRKSGQYVVKKGDTLMKISFAQYGNVYKWKKIMDDNKGKISDYRKLKAGTELRIEGDMYVVVERNGHPYLIKKNDTLLRISNKVYGDARKWPLLWKNNKQLIHDPNKIYAGFTLYYLDLEDMKLKKADFKPDDSERKPTSE